VSLKGRLGVAAAVTLIGAVVPPATASASEVLGSVGTFGGSCADNQAYVGPSVATGPDYIADAAGVVTTYSMRASNDLATIRLLVLRPEAGTNYTALQEDAARTQTVPNAVNTQTDIHLPIAAGQTIGVFVPDQAIDNGWCLTGTLDSLDIFRDFAGEPPLNSSSTWSADQGGVRMNLAATVEPDTDRDTFGDETQDNCLGTAGQFNGCPNTVILGKIKQKGTKPKIKALVTVPGPGILKVGSPSDPTLAAASANSLKPVTQTFTSKTQQQVTLTLTLTKSAKRKLADKGKLKVQVKLSFTPTGGPAGSQTAKAKLKTKLKS
jgi:hypothetical protein